MRFTIIRQKFKHTRRIGKNTSKGCKMRQPKFALDYQPMGKRSKGLKFRVFWDAVPCSHVQVDRHFRGAYYLHQGDESLS
jgi:hypothetical protein